MNLVRTDDKKYLSPWFPFVNMFDEWDDFVPKGITGVNMWETGKFVFVEFAVPSMKESDLDIQLNDGVLTVRGAKAVQDEGSEKDKKVWVSSMRTNCSYSVTLPSSAGTDVTATLEDGVLKIQIAKKEESQPKKIEVRKKTD